MQFFTGLPELLVFFHLLGAALFAAGIAWVGARLVTWRAAESDPRDPEARFAEDLPDGTVTDGGAR